MEEHSIITAHNSDIPNAAGGFDDMANEAGDRAIDDMSTFSFFLLTGSYEDSYGTKKSTSNID